ncbi:rust resistance kinase Lr10 isoform X2 [Setaria viridis]|uniref:non-specific serine/threonine protein kinase n=1 Tax=Setaria viridis TaxID=4556 RepID=A0A4V6D672_SETVI|nr:rust resistance kinase Lr10-like isoform X2 [Setaria viridis]TKW13116.1 hypothetical protein SEVIR_5G078000v2 [Setaria viridis]
MFCFSSCTYLTCSTLVVRAHLHSPQMRKMSKFILVRIALLLCLANHCMDMATAWDDGDFSRYCPPSWCSQDGLEIRFPLQLQSSNASSPSCSGGTTCTKLECSEQDTILHHPYLGPSKVTTVDYKHSSMKIIPFAERSSACPIQELALPAYVESSCELYLYDPGKLGCKTISNSVIPIPRRSYGDHSTFKQRAEAIFSSSEITVSWIQWGNGRSDITSNCRKCELSGHYCALSSQRNQTFCMPKPKGSRVKVIAVTSSVASFIVLSLVVATAFYLSLKSKYNKEVHLKVEMFLQTYGTSKPSRYSFSEVKKITRRFKERVGQGAFGSVYKGKLPNGVPVAVKTLENSIGESEEFINEVATIGRIHHANIVRLLGFCSEGTRRALIYEFLPNKSLEKYIFLCGLNTSQELLVPEKMLDIAIGIARGMEYLHQGCNQRILHFDIKPHSILLDYNLNPKISNFGLAKLCTRDQSIVTLTAARGTMGYIAPEIYSPNFGGISYKSDVYSFGMLVLEMVSGRRNSDQSIENQNEVYLPQWIYDRVVTGQDLTLTRGKTEEDKETVRKLAIVALWCIQWNPQNRPSTTKVVNMLTGRSQNLQMPPKPFVQSESHPMP